MIGKDHLIPVKKALSNSPVVAFSNNVQSCCVHLIELSTHTAAQGHYLIAKA